MFYEPRNGHGLPHDPSKAIVAPRPIGWISTRSASGALNLAPYSYFNMLCLKPFLVMFSSESAKDSVDAPRGLSEFDYAGLTQAPSRLVATPRVAEAYAALECKVTEIRNPQAVGGPASDVFLVIGEVVGVHIDDAVLTDGLFDVIKAGTVARLGYMDYAAVTETFAMRRPRWNGD
jgi:flavin reductase (DIM6/NTAB) family NADH-FMN oxidoreductase RutF